MQQSATLPIRRAADRVDQPLAPLDEVGDLLALEDGRHCREVEEIAGHKLAVVRERMAQLSKIEKLLSVLVGRCHGNSGKVRCPLIASLESATA